MVPEGWSTTKLKTLLEGAVKNGYSPIACEEETGYWVLGLGALGDDRFNPKEIKPVEPTEKVRGALLYSGDFLVSRSNTPDKVGRSIMYKGEVPQCSYPDLMMRFRINPAYANPDFIEHKLKSSDIRRYFKNSAAGSSASMVKINKGVLENTPIYLPPLPEQKKIAQILSTWDQAITATERLLESSQQRKKGLMQQLLTGKKRLPGFEGEWSVRCLGDLFAERNESGTDNSPLLSITSNEGVIYQDESGRKDTSNADKSKYKRICPGDIGYNTMRMWQGRSSLSDKDGVVSPAYTILAPIKEADSLFFSYLFKLPAMVHVFYRRSQGLVSDTWNLKYTHFKKIEWMVPPKTEQAAIGKTLLISDFEISALKVKLDCLKQEKKALMQELLTGKRRVNAETEAA
ncbi:restriction endonuclease subunit S [Marinobacter sp. 1-3A]|uniref:restriction endonuclease subunit S n=1 Tax=Marinobacter sp. 1-3A TaxID=2582920 RepID=UPI0019065CC7|nr:restriction endonuclease subunit S [Marinobacter sp. 1-3A]MBK1874934.1 restriction endonuclease subunit S [Marinobacter sp. 1-3A]